MTYSYTHTHAYTYTYTHTYPHPYSSQAGLLPVLHGDAVLTEDDAAAAILGGDELVVRLHGALRPSIVVFLTDVVRRILLLTEV